MNKPLSSDDRRLLDLLPPGSNIQDAVWLHKQSGMRIIKHRYIELLAGAQAIQTVDLDVQYWPEKSAAIAKAIVAKDDIRYISWGEAAPGNNKNSYPVAMATKRATDRAVLRAVNLHGFFYSDGEIPPDDALSPVPPPTRQEQASAIADAIGSVAHSGTVQTWSERLRSAMTVEALKANGAALKDDPEYERLTDAQIAELQRVYNETRNKLSQQEAA